MEVLQGMQITVPAPDGNSLQTIHGPTHIRMPIPANSSPPIQAPPNYQIMMKMEWELDPTNGHSVPIKVFSVVPLQNFPPYQHPGGGYPGSSHQEAAFPSPPGLMPPGLPETIAPGLGETDEEKNKIKILLGHIEAPEVVSVGTNWVDLKWNQLNKSENFKEPVSYLCEIQCMNKDQSTTPTWDIKYQGRELRYRIECLIPGSEYLSRVKARDHFFMPNVNISYAIQKIMVWNLKIKMSFQNKGKILAYKNIFQMRKILAYKNVF